MDKRILKQIKKERKMLLNQPKLKFRLYIQQFHIADFNRLEDLHSYVYYHVNSMSNNHTWDSYNVFELSKKRFTKETEKQLDWNTINYWLDNGMVK